MMSKSWYLLCYHYGKAEQTIKNLGGLGVQCFSPRKPVSDSSGKKNNSCINDKKEHLFPPYLFVEFDPEDVPFSSIKYTPGVCGFVRFGQQIKPVSEKVMHALLCYNRADREVKAMLSGIINCENKKQRAVLFLSVLEKISLKEDFTMKMAH